MLLSLFFRIRIYKFFNCFSSVCVSEGSIVVLDARNLIKDIDITNSIKNYSWKQTTDIHLNIEDSVK